ncbi:LANO_0C06260g1_1 [Lachancea nothofagi CBS 11611]|uniref:LANO_0C06260g1_1 n=1 Tax=Lachancea nothofagi CBS 11611 TaxID=1266666 RepID=A0A1G4J865_9SACH|nr:LANO_0C06260g1_1 [Lachancea nothofagi CBS 11611]
MYSSRRSRSSISISQQRMMSHSMAGLSLEQQKMLYYIGVDVGTGSARACIIDSMGNILSLAERPIQREQLKPNFITQSSQEIWQSVCHCVKSVVRDSGVPREKIHGIGFDATCSLVVVEEGSDKEVAVGPDFYNTDQNIILWMDHRAIDETAQINATGDKCLKYVGGQMSVEMEIPKIKWLKNHLPDDKFKKCKFFDLADYLTFKASGKETRSFCSTACKQGLLPVGVEGSTEGWSRDFLNEIGLEELIEDDFRRIGGSVTNSDKGKNFLSAGEFIGAIDETVAEELGLSNHCVVGSGVIDAYAGWVGTVAARTDVPIPALTKSDQDKVGIDRATGRLAAVAGTSTCHIAMSRDPIFVDGVWGPYRDVMANKFWCAEGGQSCTGALLAHVLTTHPAYTELSQLADAASVSKFDYLNSRLEMLAQQQKARSVVHLARHLFFYGDYHGNRSPIADSSMRAAIIGQSMDNSIDDLALMYLGACEFIAQQTRQIVEKMTASGHDMSTIFMSGGQCRNGLLMRLLADCTGLPIVIPRYIDAAVVFGSALLGAVASESFDISGTKSALSVSRKSSIAGDMSHNTQGKKSAMSKFGNFGGDDLPSPYTAPSATASTAQIASTVGFPFPTADEGHHYDDQFDETEEGGSELNFKAQSKWKKDMEDRMKGRSSDNGDTMWNVMYNMTGGGKVVQPCPDDNPDRMLLNTKYKIFLDMAETQRKYRQMVDEVEK